ncbi:ribonuclease H2, subunit B [Coniella lustricola]|uniref:Ribonuclease H2 subunit B n=1 Tax=Coniella lustricola TaxID=2025994 RepID=A0A2T3AGR0_9PEZI|nr:ribonuclease H2, subunit B [Coniella lustricola]
MARTRAAKGATKATSSKQDAKPSTTSSSKHALPAESSSPPRVLILPSKAGSDARVVALKHPRYSKPARYLICPETGAYEFIQISAPKTTPRSWLIEGSETQQSFHQQQGFETQVTKGADLFLATPIDPLFLALPALAAQFASTGKRMFLSSDDHLDTLNEETPHLRDTCVRWPTWRKRLEDRMAACCDTAEAGDETMFRFSEDKLVAEVLAKAEKMAVNRLPASMEEKFVTRALEAPVLGIKRVKTLQKEESTLSEAGLSSTTSSQSEADDSQSSLVAATTSTAATSVADEADTVNAMDVESAMYASEEVVKLQRLRIAFNFICSSYVPSAMTTVLKKMLAEGKGAAAANFKPLDDYVAQLAKLRQEATLSRSASDYSRKRSMDEDSEEKREKRRRKEEEEKRKKAGESRGVRDLKKVNTAGMKKLSAFFKPKGS